MEAFLTSSQENVTGEVSISLYPYRYQVNGIESPFDLMSSKFGKYGEMNLGWTGDDVKGFTKIFGNQVAIHYQVTGSQLQVTGNHLPAGKAGKPETENNL
jgi:argininosuccinate synthase